VVAAFSEKIEEALVPLRVQAQQELRELVRTPPPAGEIFLVEDRRTT
jgi:hypothetical protein